MPARAIGTANISFGLVSVPIKMYSAADTTAAIGFNLIHKDCGSRLKQKYICAKDGVEVSRDDMVKGYEFAKDQYVLFTPEELKAIEAKSDNQVEIVEFVPDDKVEPVYKDKLYYLGPDRGGDRAYRLLAAAMRETKLSALGRYNSRGKSYLILLSPMQDGIVMHQLNYADEVRPFSEVGVPEGDVKKEELKLAIQLIDQIRNEDFRPEQYKDEVRTRVLELIERKIQGEDITEAPSEAPQTQIIDLMEALKASLDRGGSKERKPARAAKKAAAAPAKGAATKRRKAAGS
jgi:DNA end-binding protein Ku